MPCYDPTYKYSKGDAILCSIFHMAQQTGMLEQLINDLNYNLIGLSKQQVLDWWERHQELDKEKLKEKH
jgi:hypothetical protein